MAESAKNLTAAEIHPDLWCLFDEFVHGDIDRRAFLDRAARFAAVSGSTAAALLGALSPDFARARRWRLTMRGW
jgi:carboxymethylenebutenolidase